MSSLKRTIINPWTWQDQFAFVQGNELFNPKRVLICAGQTSNDENGTPLFPGDMAKQIEMALDNVETVLNAAGFEFKDVMRLTSYTTDMDAFLANYGVLAGRLTARGARPAASLIGVTRFAFPEWMVEIEATAYK